MPLGHWMALGRGWQGENAQKPSKTSKISRQSMAIPYTLLWLQISEHLDH
jgi:hypothetical protein